MMWVRPYAAAAVTAALVVTMAAACGGQDRPLILAASSLSDALPQVVSGVDYSFAGSDRIAAQIRAGAPADIIVTADPAIVWDLHRDGLAGRPVIVASNRLVLVVREGVAGIGSIGDIPRHDARLALAESTVPAGQMARTLLSRLGRSDLADGPLSHQDSVRGVLGLVALGEADAGIVYATDARAVPGRVQVIPFPPGASPVAHYAAATVGNADGTSGRALLREMVSGRARRVLGRAGFGPP